MDFQPTVYIMTNRERGLPYVGVTSNLKKRIREHRLDLIHGYSRRHKLHYLAHFEPFDTMELAIAREGQLQNWHRAWSYALIEESNPEWRDLAEDFGFAALG